jgi:predicted anti-sigma-YlaC factor YlaD
MLLLLAGGVPSTVVVSTAFGAFSTAIMERDAPWFAHVVRFVLLALGLAVPIMLLVLTWWWLSRDRTRQKA